jgi:hypothetical protein
MTMFGSQWLANAGGGGYTIDQSIRFNNADDATLTRTFGTATNRKIYTLSVWEKNGNSAGSLLEYNATGGVTWANITFGQDGRIDFFDYSGGAARIDLRTSAIYRDPSAWYHVVVAVDTTQATSTDRIKMYVNGVQITSFGTATYPSLNFEGFLNSSVLHLIGDGVNGPFDGYLAEYHFVDGQALAPTDFGEYNDAGVWIPIEASPTYGNNGFYITGETASDLGEDFSGNGNDFTSSGLATTDQMLDTPTLNYCTLNPLYKDSAVVLSDGNLTATSASSNRVSMSTFAVNSGKWYWEMTFTGTMAGAVYGIGKHPVTLNNYLGIDQYGWSVLGGYSGAKLTNNSSGGFGETYKGSNVLSGETVACALDMDTGKVYWGSDGTTDGTGTFVWYASGDPVAGTNFAFSGLTGDIYPACDADSRGTMVVNFGQSPFRYSADIPTNFNALSTANLATPSITDGSAHFQPTLYTGNNGTQAIVNSGNSDLAPDLVWIKSRTTTRNHILTDAVRGVTKSVSSNTTSAEATDADNLTAFGSDGFTVGDATSYSPDVNASGVNYVAWQWAANGAGSSNTDGSITSTVSADTTSGFSIIRWSGTGANGTIGHGLGIQPSLYIVKNTATTNSWLVGSTLYSNTQFLILNATDALDTAAAIWNSAYPTSSVINLGSNAGSNGSGTNNMICYAFAEIPGYSSIGSYVGNGSATTGPFIWTGFRPAFVITKNITNAGDGWPIVDSKRSPFNTPNATLLANLTVAETTGYQVDLYSNGFKPKSTDHAVNESGATIIYMAFAENPFGGDGVAPATAR